MPHYRTRPAEVAAVRYDGGNADAVVALFGGPRVAEAESCRLPGPGRGMHQGLRVRLISGDFTADVGDWIAFDGNRVEVLTDTAFTRRYELAPGASRDL